MRTPQFTDDEQATLDSVGRRCAVIIDSHAPRASKYIRLVAVADKAMAAIAPHIICKKGCAHCCKIPLVMSEREALRIEAYTGRRAERLPNASEEPQVSIDRMRDNVERYTGVPCPFLGAENECTVYPVRPIACRTYHSLLDSPEPCDTSLGVHEIPRFNLHIIDMGVTFIDLYAPFGDVREFFP